MAKAKTTVVETKVDSKAEAIKALLVKHAHSLFEREPAPAFVGTNLDKLVAQIMEL